jgi:hypothetical protein
VESHRAENVTIDIKEAHLTDEWQMDSKEKEGVCYAQPRTFENGWRSPRISRVASITRSTYTPVVPHPCPRSLIQKLLTIGMGACENAVPKMVRSHFTTPGNPLWAWADRGYETTSTDF